MAEVIAINSGDYSLLGPFALARRNWARGWRGAATAW